MTKKGTAVVLGAFAVALGACGSCRTDRSPAAAPDAGAAVRFLALGDSFTIGTGAAPELSFPARLVATWSAGGCAAELRNVAVNGYTTDDLVARELPELDAYHPTFITLAIGANDIVRGRTPEAYRANLAKIFGALSAARAGGARVLVLPQPDWSRSPTARTYGDPSAFAESIKSFNAILEREAVAAGVTWVDLAPLMDKQAADQMLARDGLHPSSAAYAAWADAIARKTPPPCK